MVLKFLSWVLKRYWQSTENGFMKMGRNPVNIYLFYLFFIYIYDIYIFFVLFVQKLIFSQGDIVENLSNT